MSKGSFAPSRHFCGLAEGFQAIHRPLIKVYVQGIKRYPLFSEVSRKAGFLFFRVGGFMWALLGQMAISIIVGSVAVLIIAFVLDGF